MNEAVAEAGPKFNAQLIRSTTPALAVDGSALAIEGHIINRQTAIHREKTAGLIEPVRLRDARSASIPPPAAMFQAWLLAKRRVRGRGIENGGAAVEVDAPGVRPVQTRQTSFRS